jgi:hypothetical protein
VVMETSGAIFLGGSVSSTISGGRHARVRAYKFCLQSKDHVSLG